LPAFNQTGVNAIFWLAGGFAIVKQSQVYHLYQFEVISMNLYALTLAVTKS
jgi:hypothetical protein